MREALRDGGRTDLLERRDRAKNRKAKVSGNNTAGPSKGRNRAEGKASVGSGKGRSQAEEKTAREKKGKKKNTPKHRSSARKSQPSVPRHKKIPDVDHGDARVYQGRSQRAGTRQAAPANKEAHVEIQQGARVAESLTKTSEPNLKPLFGSECVGAPTQLDNERKNDTVEVNIGVDVGTSAVKVVIADLARKKSYAVPFFDASGVDRYLVPARLRKKSPDGKYQLSVFPDDGHIRDIKLAYFDSSEGCEARWQFIGLLAIVISHARGWFLCEKSDVYRNAQILWRVTVGYPSPYYCKTDRRRQSVVRDARVAWHLSKYEKGVNVREIQEAERILSQQGIGEGEETQDEEVQVVGVPESAAQIYGFVNSAGFDTRAANNYLMVDVGGGTIDSCLFHVRKARGERWEFFVYKSLVEPHGAINLHQYRVKWWKKKIEGGSGDQNLRDQLRSIEWPVDRRGKVPGCFREYLEGVKVGGGESEDNPDRIFLGRILTQVRGDTLNRAVQEGLLGKLDIKNIPTFYTGGGMHIKFYRNVIERMKETANYSYLRAQEKKLDVPRDLEAKGVASDDYSRLAVAYGLSRMDLKRIEKAAALPKTDRVPGRPSSWRSLYVSKDAV